MKFPEFSLGESVYYEGHSSGRVRYSKEAKIVAIIPPGTWPEKILEETVIATGGQPKRITGLSRGHESYLILVPCPSGITKGSIYWPNVRRLKKMEVS